MWPWAGGVGAPQAGAAIRTPTSMISVAMGAPRRRGAGEASAGLVRPMDRLVPHCRVVLAATDPPSMAVAVVAAEEDIMAAGAAPADLRGAVTPPKVGEEAATSVEALRPLLQRVAVEGPRREPTILIIRDPTWHMERLFRVAAVTMAISLLGGETVLLRRQLRRRRECRSSRARRPCTDRNTIRSIIRLPPPTIQLASR